ncbi:MAG: PEP-CTERM sorting domain-containing protein [Bryobacterales bacterium]|nr:PEP-CTERM sorting domain-containing protein [Bryobacterales bacterium]
MFKTLILSLTLASAIPAHAAVFTATGAAPGDIQTAVDNFRSALGANNGVGGSFASGRREINWDAVPNAFASPNALPGNFFNVNSPRGAVFSTPGSGFQVSATLASGTPVEFGNIDPSYTAEFQTFSAERLFTPIGSNIMQIDFFVPGTTTPASVAGFGAVFTDVELAAQTIFTVFYGDGSNGGQFAVPAGPNGGLSFLGLTDNRRYSRIIIQTGTTALAAGVIENLRTPGVDLVAMDDFIYGEPLSANGVPEPGSMLLTLAGAAALFLYRRK